MRRKSLHTLTLAILTSTHTQSKPLNHSPTPTDEEEIGLGMRPVTITKGLKEVPNTLISMDACTCIARATVNLVPHHTPVRLKQLYSYIQKGIPFV